MVLSEEEKQEFIDRIADLLKNDILKVEDRNQILWCCMSACVRELRADNAKEG